MGAAAELGERMAGALDELAPADRTEVRRLDELTALLDAGEPSPDLRLVRRVSPVRTTRLEGSVPASLAGSRAERTIGPIQDRFGRPVWFEFHRRIGQLHFVRSSGATPFLALPITQVQVALLGSVSFDQLQLRAGSLWLQSRLFAGAAPPDAYTGLRLAGGRLRTSASVTVAGEEVVVPAGVALRLEIDLDPPSPPAGSGPGQDVRDATARMPDAVTFVITAAGATVEVLDEPALVLYEAAIGFTGGSGAAAYHADLNRIALPLVADATDLEVGTVRSTTCRPAGKAPILAAAWALPAARTTPADLGEASGVGALMLDLGPGLRASWTGQDQPVPLGATRWLLDEARLSVSAPAAPVPAAARTLRPPLAGGRSLLELFWTAPFPFDFFAEASGSEAVVTTGEVHLALNRPVDVAGDRVPVRAAGAQISFTELPESRFLLVSAAWKAAPGRLAFGLKNVILHTSLPYRLNLVMRYDGVTVGTGIAGLSFEFHGLTASLPDPYATNVAGMARRQGELSSVVHWAEAGTTLEFRLPQGVAPALVELGQGAGERRRVAADRDDPRFLVALRRETEPWNPEVLGDALDFERHPRLILLDVSTKVSQFGVALHPPPERGSSRFDPGDAPIRPLEVRGLDLAADARTLVLVTLPAVQWEPVVCEATGDDPSLPPQLRFDNSGVPTTIDVPTVELVPVTPEAALDALVGAKNRQRAHMRTTLPFGMLAQIRLRAPVLAPGATIDETRPKSDEGLEGGRQLTIRALDRSLASDQTPALPGFAVQLPVANPGGRSVLGASVTPIFNSYLGAGSPNALVPVSRLDLSGFGQSLFSAWNNPTDDLPQVSKAGFDVLLGRTAYEVVQVKTFKLPFFTPMVKTITFTRRSNGGVFRQESDWTALGDGKYRAPPGSGVVTHPGAVRRLTSVTNVRETGRRVTHGGIAFAEVRFDGLIELEGVNPPLVPVRGHVGFLQIEAVPLTATAYAELIAAEGSLCGTMAATIRIGFGPAQMRIHRIGVGIVDTAAGHEFAMAAWGGLAFPGGGEWSALRVHDALGAPGPVPEAEGLPLIRAGAAGGPSVGPYRFADPADLARPSTPARDYGILHATGTQRAFFRRPRIETSDLSRIVGDERAVIADPYVLATAVGPFPRQADCIPTPPGTWALAVGTGGAFRLELPGGATFATGVGRRTMRAVGSVRSDLDYTASMVTYEVDTTSPVPWRFGLTRAARVMNHTAMGDLTTLVVDIEAEAGRETVFLEPQLRLGGAFEIVQDVLTILEDLGIPGVFKTVMTNAMSMKATLKVPIVTKSGEDFTIPPVDPSPANYALIFADCGILSTAERKCIAVAEQECVSRRDDKGPARGPCHLAVSLPAVGCRRTWASVDGACSAGADSCHRSSRGCGRDG